MTGACLKPSGLHWSVGDRTLLFLCWEKIQHLKFMSTMWGALHNYNRALNLVGKNTVLAWMTLLFSPVSPIAPAYRQAWYHTQPILHTGRKIQSNLPAKG